MRNWEDFIWLFKQPKFIALFLFAMSLPLLLKYLRRFYPKSLQKITNETEAFTEELAKNKSDSKLVKQSTLYEAMLIFLPAFLIFSIYLISSYFNGTKLSPYFVKNSIAFIFSPVLFIGIGIFIINHESILKYKLKDNYQRYLDIYNKVNTIDPFSHFIEEHKKIFGYMFIVLGLITLVNQFIM